MSSRFLRLVELMGMLLDQLRLLGWIGVDSSGKYQLAPELARRIREGIPRSIKQGTYSEEFSCRKYLELSAESLVRDLLGTELSLIKPIYESGSKMLAKILAILVLMSCGNCPNSSRSYPSSERYLKSILSSGCIQAELGYA